MTRIQPDLVFLQEFFREPETEELLEKLADHLWPHHSYGKNAVSGDYHYGNAILSRFPIEETKNFNISTSAYESRGILYARIHFLDMPINLFCTHLDLTESGRMRQVVKIDKVVSSICPRSDPLILAGDFNDWNNRLYGHFKQHLDLEDALHATKGFLVPTFPSVFPLFSFDKIYSRHFEVINGDRIFDNSLRYQSDHLPIITELKLKR